MTYLTISITLLTSFYCFILFKLIHGLLKLKKGTNQREYVVSIIVAARNEEQNIKSCVTALISQNYPLEKLEIIVVDDRSTDETAKIVQKFTEAYPNVILLQVKQTPSGMAPKKYALDFGINQATGEIILITDADCIPQPDWVKFMLSYFKPDVGLVAGFSPLDRAEKPSVLSRLIRLDSLALASVAAGSFGAGFPLTCNARNLAYRRSVYQQIGGFKEIGHLISGDDDLFLHLVQKKTDWQVRYAIDSEVIVSSIVPSNFNDFFHQRVRHASKGRHYAVGLKLGLIAVYLFNISLLLLLLLSIWNTQFLLLFGGSFVLKTLFEFILLKKSATIFNRHSYLKYFPLAALFHIPYVTIFGLWGQIGKFTWKGSLFQAELKPTIKKQGT